jgi:hypothetical protein
VIDQPSKKRLIESLCSSVTEFRDYYIDQNDYNASIPEPRGQADYGKLFLIFHSVEYMGWVNTSQKSPVLVLRGSSVLELAASNVVHGLKDNKLTNLVLNFFYGSTTHMFNIYDLGNLTYDWQHLFCVWTLLLQVVNDTQLHQQQHVLAAFFSQALASIDGSEFEKMSADIPIKAFQSLVRLCELQHLWNSLAQAINKSEDLGALGRDSDLPEKPQNKRKLTFVFDLDDMGSASCNLLINSIRPIIRNLRRHFTAVKILVTNPPIIENLELHESEVLLDYDIERRGLC